MKVYLNKITGIDDAIVSMFLSKRSWTRELENEIRDTCHITLDSTGRINLDDFWESHTTKFNTWMSSLVKWGWKHTTMLRFIDMSITVEGLHRGGQDSHAQRFNNRIIRSSTRLATFGNEISEWYQDKIIPTDVALSQLGVVAPDKLTHNGVVYIKSINGYIREDLKDNPDAKRGLYMLNIPSNFIFKVNMTEWAHVYKERNKDSSANEEVKICCESIADQIEQYHKQFNRDYFLKIKN
jgi:hypothetical protein